MLFVLLFYSFIPGSVVARIIQVIVDQDAITRDANSCRHFYGRRNREENMKRNNQEERSE